MGCGYSGVNLRRPAVGCGYSGVNLRRPAVGCCYSGVNLRRPAVGCGYSGVNLRRPAVGCGYSGVNLRRPAVGCGYSGVNLRRPAVGCCCRGGSRRGSQPGRKRWDSFMYSTCHIRFKGFPTLCSYYRLPAWHSMWLFQEFTHQSPAYMHIHVGTPQGSSRQLHLWGGAWGGVSVPLPSHTWCTLPHEPQRCSLCGWNCELWGEGDTFGCIYKYMYMYVDNIYRMYIHVLRWLCECVYV